jgi:hypothetical protein
MAQYRKRPIEVEAEVYRAGLEDGFDYHIALFGMYDKEECIKSGFTPDFEKDKIPFLNTRQGKVYITKGDVIITQSDGEKYPCNPINFVITYEKVE